MQEKKDFSEKWKIHTWSGGGDTQSCSKQLSDLKDVWMRSVRNGGLDRLDRDEMSLDIWVTVQGSV